MTDSFLPLQQVTLDGQPLLYPAYGPSKSGSAVLEVGQRFPTLPGHGEKKGSCGMIRFATRCSSPSCEAHSKLHLHHECCNSMLCPTCHTKAEERAALRGQRRIEGMKGAYEQHGESFGPLDHVELSYAPDTWTEEFGNTLEGFRTIRQAHVQLVRKFCRNAAGALVVHYWRFKHLDGSTCENENCRLSHRPVFSPHAHYVGYGYWLRSDIVHARTGAVYKKIQPGRPRNLFATLSYELSHCTLMVEVTQVHDYTEHLDVQGTARLESLADAVVYLGKFSNAKGGFVQESKTHEVQKCRHCGSEVHEYDVDLVAGELVAIGDRGPHEVKCIKGYWYLNKRLHRPDWAAPPPA